MNSAGMKRSSIPARPARVLLSTLLLMALCLPASYVQASYLCGPRLPANAPAAGQAGAQRARPASWITPPGITGTEFGVYHFRKELRLEAPPERFTIQVSADNRYRLYVNGVSIVAGPQRSDLMHWRFEEVDIAPWLRVGDNVIAALVWNWGEHKPVAQHSFRTGFLVRGATAAEAVVNTGSTPWKVLANRGYSALPVSGGQVGGYYAAPPGEQLDASFYPWGWKQAGYDDSGWQDAVVIGQATDRGSFPFNAGGWQLVPRSIPFMEERPVRFASVRRTEGLSAEGIGGEGIAADGVSTEDMTTDGGLPRAPGLPNSPGSPGLPNSPGSPGLPEFQGFLNNTGTLVVPADTHATILLDQAHLTNAYLQMETSGGAGSTIKVTYAEALKDEQGIKGHRDEIEGKSISGVEDVFLPEGGAHRRFQTLWFRTYRYVELEIETGGEPLEIHDVSGLYTAYPQTMEAGFESDLPWLEDMWAINWRVLRLCAWETYFDTPYYEQLQYIGDTRLQALVTLYMSGDDRLMRQAITHFDISRIPEGITASRYPSDLGQYIPTFSLLWVAMVHDYWMYRDDEPYLRGLMPGVRSVLAWFEEKVDEAGLVGPLPWWPFVDWTDGWASGMPPGAQDGHSVMITLQYVYALQRAVELEESIGRQAEANRLRALAGRLLEAVRSQSYDSERGLFRDSLEQATFSQHTNTMAILTGAVPEGERRALMERVLDDPSLTQAGYYFEFYVFEALREAGLASRYIEQLAPWQEMLAQGLTTTPEEPPPSRTDSHAWAAHPNRGLLATVLGIRPGEPGFKSVLIAPHLGPLQRAEGRMPHPLGSIEVELRRVGESGGEEGIEARITLPVGLGGVFEWGGKKEELRPGPQAFELYRE